VESRPDGGEIGQVMGYLIAFNYYYQAIYFEKRSPEVGQHIVRLFLHYQWMRHQHDDVLTRRRF
jgi:hypothetical protein